MNLSVRFANAKPAVHVVVRAITCCTVLALPACQIPKLRHADPGPDLPADFSGASSPENSARLGVDEFFNNPTLTRIIAQAMTDNQELRILNQDIQIANNEILSRRGAYLPFVGFRGGAGMEKPSRYTPAGAVEDQLEFLPGRHFPDPLPNFMFGADLFWQLDIWRELRNARDAAIQRYYAAIDKRNYFVTRLVADIAENYYELMALDNRLIILDQTIAIQEDSLKVAEANKQAGRGTELGVQRFQAEVRKNQSEKLIVRQEIIETENKINFLAGRYPQPVERQSAVFIDLNLHALNVGVPAQLLQNRPDIRQAERELVAAGLDVKVARAHFFPRVDITAGVGYQAFNPRYLLLTPESLIYNVAGDLTAPLINKRAIQADYLSANARQLESVYNYQRVILNAFTEVVNRVSKVQNYYNSVEIKKQQLKALAASVDIASQLFLTARTDYIDVLFAQRDLMEARMILVNTKRQQLTAVVNAYQALGGGNLLANPPQMPTGPLAGPPLPVAPAVPPPGPPLPAGPAGLPPAGPAVAPPPAGAPLPAVPVPPAPAVAPPPGPG